VSFPETTALALAGALSAKLTHKSMASLLVPAMMLMCGLLSWRPATLLPDPDVPGVPASNAR
jgi:hypothetical protein